MKKGFISIFVLAFIFSFNLSALADEGHEDNVKQATENFRNGTNEQEEQSKETNTHVEEEANPEHTDVHSEEAGTQSEEQETHGDDAGAEDHHAPVMETPPNYKVLGTYGAVNAAFIFIGIWNKWFRRKGNK